MDASVQESEEKEKKKGREERNKGEKEREEGREGREKEEKEGKRERKEEKRRGFICFRRGDAEFFFFLLKKYQVYLFRGNPLSGQRNPFKGGGVIRHPFGGLGLETGQKGCHPLLKGVAFF